MHKTMPAKPVEHEYDEIRSEFGEAVANRWAYATMKKAGKTDFELADFYQMYSDGGNGELAGVTEWPLFYAKGNPWAIGREKMAAELSRIVSANPENFACLAWLFSRPMSEIADLLRRARESDDESDQLWAAWLESLNGQDVCDIWTLLFRRHPSPNLSDVFDAQIAPYRAQGKWFYQGAAVPNEQEVASEASTVMNGREFDYSKKDFGQFALWKDGRTVSERSEHEIAKMHGERLQRKIDRRINK
ncbi:hypothetical protein [Burkholderia anthina]|uniref:hypothetical protein n=1 Tax=Burkholderia anthina TaxID=179879 RepID=UPI001588ED74|nr:hypothetical protein [Burkholderia anthina]